MFENSVQSIILAQYPHFTATERTIADFFLNSTVNTDLAARAVAQHLYVSEATLTRFAKKCGFDGYRTFVYEYAIHNHTLANPDQVKRSIFNHYQQLITSGYDRMKPAVIRAVVQKMLAADHIFAYGIGSSGTAVTEMKYRMMRIGISIDAMTDTQMMNMNLNNYNASTLLMCLTISAGNVVVNHLPRAKQNGAQTVLITSNDHSAFAKFADETLLVPYLPNLEIGNVVSPTLPLLLAIDLLYANILLEDPSRLKLLSHTVAPNYRHSTATTLPTTESH